jgi:hypothetical protein
MPILRRRSATLALTLLMAVCAAATPRAARAQADDRVVAEARAFMEAYSRDLSAADRDGIADRYDRRGAYFVFNGNREFSEWDAIREQYRREWQAPAVFSWGDLIYEPAGRNAVLVNGFFFWTRAPGESPMRFSYTGLLVRQDGELRIRLENEFPSEAPLPAEAPPTP